MSRFVQQKYKNMTLYSHIICMRILQTLCIYPSYAHGQNDLNTDILVMHMYNLYNIACLFSNLYELINGYTTITTTVNSPKIVRIPLAPDPTQVNSPRMGKTNGKKLIKTHQHIS